MQMISVAEEKKMRERDKLTPCKGCKYYKLNYKEVMLYWTPGYFCMLKGRKIDENDRDCEEYEEDEDLCADIPSD